MFCDKCGAQVSENAKFCPRCGNRLQETENRSIDENIERSQNLLKKSVNQERKNGLRYLQG